MKDCLGGFADEQSGGGVNGDGLDFGRGEGSDGVASLDRNDCGKQDDEWCARHGHPNARYSRVWRRRRLYLALLEPSSARSVQHLRTAERHAWRFNLGYPACIATQNPASVRCKAMISKVRPAATDITPTATTKTDTASTRCLSTDRDTTCPGS